jgi:hypothetical protein
MPATRSKPTRRRPVSVRVMMTAAERKEMRRAAFEADMPLSTWMRTLALVAVRQGTRIVSEARAA